MGSGASMAAEGRTGAKQGLVAIGILDALTRTIDAVGSIARSVPGDAAARTLAEDSAEAEIRARLAAQLLGVPQKPSGQDGTVPPAEAIARRPPASTAIPSRPAAAITIEDYAARFEPTRRERSDALHARLEAMAAAEAAASFPENTSLAGPAPKPEPSDQTARTAAVLPEAASPRPAAATLSERDGPRPRTG